MQTLGKTGQLNKSSGSGSAAKCSKMLQHTAVVPSHAQKEQYNMNHVGMAFVRSLLRAGVQPTLDPSAETFMSVQCASPERGGELVGVCGVCASCVGWRKG